MCDPKVKLARKVLKKKQSLLNVCVIRNRKRMFDLSEIQLILCVLRN